MKVGFWHEGEAEGGAKPVRLCPCSSDVNLFSYGERIIDFNAEIPDSALDLRMSMADYDYIIVGAGSPGYVMAKLALRRSDRRPQSVAKTDPRYQVH